MKREVKVFADLRTLQLRAVLLGAEGLVRGGARGDLSLQYSLPYKDWFRYNRKRAAEKSPTTDGTERKASSANGPLHVQEAAPRDAEEPQPTQPSTPTIKPKPQQKLDRTPSETTPKLGPVIQNAAGGANAYAR